MAAQPGENGAVRVSPMDQRGRPISPRVLKAAEEVRQRAIHHAEKLLVDPAVAANLLEEAAATVSRALKAKSADGRPVQDLESYLFRAFLRRLNKNKKRKLLQQTHGGPPFPTAMLRLREPFTANSSPVNNPGLSS